MLPGLDGLRLRGTGGRLTLCQGRVSRHIGQICRPRRLEGRQVRPASAGHA